MVQCSKTNTLQFQRRSIWDGRIKQDDSQFFQKCLFYRYPAFGKLLSVKELKLSAFGEAAYSGRHFEVIYLIPSADSKSSTSIY